MTKSEMVEITIKIPKKAPFNFPLTFITGYDHYKQIGIKTSRVGMIIYVFTHSDFLKIKETFPKQDRISVYVIPDSVSYLAFMIKFFQMVIEDMDFPTHKIFMKLYEIE